MRLRKVPAGEIERRMREVAGMLGIEALLARKPRELSGGQRQRVALGRALLRDPVAFLLDEPLSNLDAKLRAQMRTELVKLHKKVGRTIVHVTHDQVEAMTMGERICIMNEGRIVQVGPPMEVYRNPADTFVAGFLASPPMNLLAGRISDGRLETGGITFPLDGFDASNGRDVILGIRPEDLHEEPTGAAPVAVEVTVIAVEALGPEVVLVGEIQGSGQELSARLHRDFFAPSGAGQRIYLDTSQMRLFDAKTTRAIARQQ
jgi:multiple sugar transport system ATP-binding protein